MVVSTVPWIAHTQPPSLGFMSLIYGIAAISLMRRGRATYKEIERKIERKKMPANDLSSPAVDHRERERMSTSPRRQTAHKTKNNKNNNVQNIFIEMGITSINKWSFIRCVFVLCVCVCVRLRVRFHCDAYCARLLSGWSILRSPNAQN